MDKINILLDKLYGVQATGRDKWVAKCPAHADNEPSLSIARGEKGIVLNCFAGCSYDEIITAVGLSPHDLFYDDCARTTARPAAKTAAKPATDKSENASKPRPTLSEIRRTWDLVTEYIYTDEHGQPLYKKQRYETRDNEGKVNKTFLQCRYNSVQNNYLDGLGDTRRVLYRVADVLNNDTVWIVEGEKDVDTLYSLEAGYTATCSAESGTSFKADYLHSLKNKTIYILPDYDTAGYKRAELLARMTFTDAKMVYIVNPRDIVPDTDIALKTDITDIVNMVGSARALAGLAVATDKAVLLTADNLDSVCHDLLVLAENLDTTGKYKAPDNAGDNLPELKTAHDYAVMFSEWGTAQLFAKHFRGKVLYCSTNNKFYVWNGKVWAVDTDITVIELVSYLSNHVLTKMVGDIDPDYRPKYFKWLSSLLVNKKAAQMLKYVKSAPGMACQLSDFDSDPKYINCQNGILNLETLELLPHNPKYMLSKIICADYNPAAKCGRWNDFIDEVMDGRKDAALFLQKAAGYSLTGSPQEDCFFILYGSKSRNGKSTFCTAISALLGDYAASTQPETVATKLYKDSNAPSGDLAALKGKRFVVMSELDKSMKLNAALVKSLSGRDKISARYMYQELFTYTPQFVMFMNTNYLPRIDDLTLFKSGRVMPIPFDVHFERDKQDTGLSTLFATQEARSAILNWCIDGLIAYRLNGLKTDIPACVRQLMTNYLHDSDIIGRYINDCFEFKQGSQATFNDAYGRYVDWCDDNGHKPLSTNKFSRELEYRDIERTRTKKARVYNNVRILWDDETQDYASADDISQYKIQRNNGNWAKKYK